MPSSSSCRSERGNGQLPAEFSRRFSGPLGQPNPGLLVMRADSRFSFFAAYNYAKPFPFKEILYAFFIVL